VTETKNAGRHGRQQDQQRKTTRGYQGVHKYVDNFGFQNQGTSPSKRGQ
jgi:hypothetical protein